MLGHGRLQQNQRFLTFAVYVAWLIVIIMPQFASCCHRLGKVRTRAFKLTRQCRSAQTWKCTKVLHTADLGAPQTTNAQCFFGVNFVPKVANSAPNPPPVTTGRKMLQAGY